MAADGIGINKLQIKLIHGQHRYDVILELPAEETEVLSVDHLTKEVAHITGIPAKNQRLIVKGRSLTNPEASLLSYGLKDGSKIMLIGKKFNEEEDGHMKHMSNIETKVDKTDSKLRDVIEEVDGIHRGFLSSDLKDEALKNLGKRLTVCVEEFTQHLEALDSLPLSNATQEVRGRRKQLITKIQDLISRCEATTTDINEMVTGVR